MQTALPVAEETEALVSHRRSRGNKSSTLAEVAVAAKMSEVRVLSPDPAATVVVAMAASTRQAKTVSTELAAVGVEAAEATRARAPIGMRRAAAARAS